MRLELFVDTPYGPSDLCSIDAYIHQYDEGPTHDWTGQLKVGDKVVDRTRGAITMELPPIVHKLPTESKKKRGRPLASARDIGVYLARCCFERQNGLRGCNDRVLDLWWGEPGFSDVRAVDKKYDNAKDYLRDTSMALLAYGGETGDDDAVMVALERGARIELRDSHPNQCVVRGPFWAWHFGEKKAVHFRDGSVEIHLKSDVPAAWLALGQQTA